MDQDERMIAALKVLRKDFPDNQVSWLPKPTKRKDEMDRLPKAKCEVCGGYHATQYVIHLAYVGHAAITDRLLDADPCWSWEPLSIDANGLPVFDKIGGLWIKLRVAGMTRLGYGHAAGKEGGDAIKEVIGDAIRNAAMRFGAALQLWHKGELHAHRSSTDFDEEPPPPMVQRKSKDAKPAEVVDVQATVVETPPPPPPAPPPPPPPAQPPAAAPVKAAAPKTPKASSISAGQLNYIKGKMGSKTPNDAAALLAKVGAESVDELTIDQFTELRSLLVTP